MSYQISIEEFQNGKMFNSNGKISHKSGNRFRLFPFVTNAKSASGLELEPLIGNYLCLLDKKTTKEITVEDLCSKLREVTDVQEGKNELFEKTIRELFFTSEGTIRPLNLVFLEHMTSEDTNEKRIAEYLVEVLGDRDNLQEHVERAKNSIVAESNVLEKLVLSKLQFDELEPDRQELSYYRITNSLKEAFEEDFIYVLENHNRSREYLVALLELYYFTYTSQAILKLNRFLEGERDGNIPLYFSLDWEKTSQNRMCYKEGWQKLQGAIGKMLAHAIVLEILNQTEPGSELVDYIRIAEMIQDKSVDRELGKEIMDITDCYRNAISDCTEMQSLSPGEPSESPTSDAIDFLFRSVVSQFENTVRERPYKSYAKMFEDYCHKYLKSRGRSGLMLNLSEEMLIFLTRLCIKNQEQMRLKDVFNEFEKRGVFLDGISKEQIAHYYERLNLIEKKSDSGDAKYVKRIL
ncbi:MAG: DNA phosphorothioation-dependent restriction protein DptG [Clostridia bacterium]|nr:DNA phosphorothioation-dependent restriction protein DptG [Clostridia bacterium]